MSGKDPGLFLAGTTQGQRRLGWEVTSCVFFSAFLQSSGSGKSEHARFTLGAWDFTRPIGELRADTASLGTGDRSSTGSRDRGSRSAECSGLSRPELALLTPRKDLSPGELSHDLCPSARSSGPLAPRKWCLRTPGLAASRSRRRRTPTRRPRPWA